MTQLIMSALAALALAISGCTSQRSHSPTGETAAAPASGPAVPTADTPNTQDRMFVDQAALGGMAEVEFGRVAEQRAVSAQVRQFGQRMVADHGQSNARLTALAEENGIALPKGLDDEHRAARARLEAMSGHEFDVAYMRRQVGDHQKTVQLLAWEINSGQDAEIKDFAADTLPVVMAHLDSAKRILSGLTGRASLLIAPPLSPVLAMKICISAPVWRSDDGGMHAIFAPLRVLPGPLASVRTMARQPERLHGWILARDLRSKS